MATAYKLFNFEFPSRVNTITLGPYTISRVVDYEERLQGLQHLTNQMSEFRLRRTTGGHQVTAEVHINGEEPKPVLGMQGQHKSHLDDVCLMLSFATGRHVFYLSPKVVSAGELVILADSRVFQWGQTLQLALLQGPIAADMGGARTTMERAISAVMQRVSDEAWQNRYFRGHFLFGLLQAYRIQSLESSFVLAWVLWEQLFAAHNMPWLKPGEIQKTNSINKLAFCVVKFGLVEEIGAPKCWTNLELLVKIRNRLVHAGKFPGAPEDLARMRNLAGLGVRLTAWVVSRILGLEPHDTFQVRMDFESLLSTGAIAKLPS